MEDSLRNFLMALTLTIMVGGAWAQDSATVTDNCANHLNTSPNPTVGAMLNCLAEMQRTINRLEAAASAPAGLPQSDIAAVARELKDNHLDAIRDRLGNPGRPGSDALFPSGAVVAFDLPNGCPAGWTAFEEATSRTIVGAYMDRAAGNVNAPTEDMNGKALSARHYRATGGAEMYTLTEDDLPSHNHFVSTGYREDRVWHDGLEGYPGSRALLPGNPDTKYGTGIDDKYMDPNPKVIRLGGHGPQKEVISFTGGDEPHNNMAPYIALYYCKKT